LKTFLACLLIIGTAAVKAQQVDSIYIHLYTDSLKKGTYNYINIDGRLANGSYLPLDSTMIEFKSSAGKFYGNSLLVDTGFTAEKIRIEVTLKQNPALTKTFWMPVKTMPDNEVLKTPDELLKTLQTKKKKPAKQRDQSP
jgi:hypothetical protein